MACQSLHIQLLGGFLLVEDDAPVTTLHAPRLQALLCLLILTRDTPTSRQHLAFCLWPNSSEAQAQTNLRNLLHQLRRFLPRANDTLVFNGRTVQWRSDAPFSLDVASFEQALSQADHAVRCGEDAMAQVSLETAIACYRGDLLPGCHDEWILPERERLRQRFTAALERLLPLLEAQGDYPAARQCAQRLIEIEPLHEATYLQLMRLHALSGDRAAALHTYQTCAARLQHELATEPGQPLRDFYTQLLMKPPPLRSTRQKLVGRRNEWARLLRCWHIATSGQPQMVVLAGEAGIGKTRLAEELLHWAEQQSFSTASAHCYPCEGELIYAPIITWLRAYPISSMHRALSPAWLAEITRLLPELRDERPDLPLAGPLNEPWQRQRLFEALRRAVLAAAQPLLLFLDDLQWCDHASLEWLRYLLYTAAPTRLLVVSSVRDEEVNADHPLVDLITDLRAQGRGTTIDLAPLDAAETVVLASHIAGQPLSVEQGTAVYRETEGNPLFIVEAMRAGCAHQRTLVCGGADEVILPEPVPLPSRVHAVIFRRLAQLSPQAYDLAGMAAVIGRSFSAPILAQVCLGLDEDTLVRSLDELWRRRIIREHPDGIYDFSHAKLREVAYQELSMIRRRQIHRRVAETLETLSAPHRDLRSGQVADHYEQAGCHALAITAYIRAAEAARAVYALEDSVCSYRRALALLTASRTHGQNFDLPKTLEIDLQVSLGEVLAHAGQHAEAHHVFQQALACTSADHARAKEHARRALDMWHETPIIYPIHWSALWPLIAVDLAANEIAAAIDSARALLHALQHQPPESLTAVLHTAIESFDSSRYDAARACLSDALALAQELRFL